MRKLLLYFIRLYQLIPVNELHQSCRFQPTCSEYTYQAIEKYGIVRGSYLGVKRILRCRPGVKSGYDPLPTKI